MISRKKLISIFLLIFITGVALSTFYFDNLEKVQQVEKEISVDDSKDLGKEVKEIKKDTKVSKREPIKVKKQLRTIRGRLPIQRSQSEDRIVPDYSNLNALNMCVDGEQDLRENQGSLPEHLIFDRENFCEAEPQHILAPEVDTFNQPIDLVVGHDPEVSQEVAEFCPDFNLEVGKECLAVENFYHRKLLEDKQKLLNMPKKRTWGDFFSDQWRHFAWQWQWHPWGAGGIIFEALLVYVLIEPTLQNHYSLLDLYSGMMDDFPNDPFYENLYKGQWWFKNVYVNPITYWGKWAGMIKNDYLRPYAPHDAIRDGYNQAYYPFPFNWGFKKLPPLPGIDD